jgi:hypothetical protein
VGFAVFAPMILNLLTLLPGTQLMEVVLLITAFKGRVSLLQISVSLNGRLICGLSKISICLVRVSMQPLLLVEISVTVAFCALLYFQTVSFVLALSAVLAASPKLQRQLFTIPYLLLVKSLNA